MPGARVSAGERVVLRTVEEEDAPFCQRASANPGIRVPLGTPLRSRGEMDDITESEEGDQFLVCVDDADAGPGTPDDGATTPIGWVGVEDVSYRRPELAYWLVPEHHGEGYGREMLELVVDYVFATYDHPAVGAGAYDFNDASRGLLESLGSRERSERDQARKRTK
ncbi:RimJ/RimL family protein N-acetyltransferase [Halolamina salifodinae]|uniref:RimJ/RimL family protein N-acetyltransferase n=1 Tax=Halolamina salifodinae TaxID=1202767 RepID=A0A8T4H030_9EURY|nr:GNAT family N-acetyltransferase [Halolamina salifodinae]MBP1986708.1 RimJ/RimL family protein N-acetyltransferase [Halolamina salifodinae]